MSDLVALAFAMMKSNRNKLRSPDYRCGVSRSMLEWYVVPFLSKDSGC